LHTQRPGRFAFETERLKHESCACCDCACNDIAAMTAQAATPPGALAAARQQVESADYRMSGHLVRVDGSGARTSYASILVRIGSQVCFACCWKSLLPRTRGSMCLWRCDRRGKTRYNWCILSISPYRRALRQMERWPLGDGFSYEDFLEAQYFWAGQSAPVETKFGARDCDV